MDWNRYIQIIEAGFKRLSRDEKERLVTRMCQVITVGCAVVLASFFYQFVPTLIRAFAIPAFIIGSWFIATKMRIPLTASKYGKMEPPFRLWNVGIVTALIVFVAGLFTALPGNWVDTTPVQTVQPNLNKSTNIVQQPLHKATEDIGIIGIAFGRSHGRGLVIDTVHAGTPAQKGNIKAGDEILKIDGLSTKGLARGELYECIVGKPDTSVKLTIKRNGRVYTVPLKRMHSAEFAKDHPELWKLYLKDDAKEMKSVLSASE